MLDTLTLTRPDDRHLHVRDHAALHTVVPHTARCFGRAIIMPNLKPAVTRLEQAQAYRQRILAAVPADSRFQPLMTLYLTDNTPAEEIQRARASGDIHALKYYPAGATTNSDSGVTDIKKTYPALEAMEAVGMPLLLHGEVTDATVDIFDREAVFIDHVLTPLLKRFPKLKVVLEHITTRQAAEFIHAAPDNVAATITPQHLLYNRNALFQGGIRPHYFCLPVLKREQHRQALIDAVCSGSHKFFLGTDSAPHARASKESACGCAGIYSAHAAMEFYAEAFEAADALDKLEGFASFYGADFYGLPRNADTITLQKKAWQVTERYRFADEDLVPLRAGETLAWQLTQS
ncbi:MAG: dihydroorotase [Gammaproteobacteria bacterium]